MAHTEYDSVKDFIQESKIKQLKAYAGILIIIILILAGVIVL